LWTMNAHIFKLFCQFLDMTHVQLRRAGHCVLSACKVRRMRGCVHLRVFASRRRPAPRGCTTFYKRDPRFTYATRRGS